VREFLASEAMYYLNVSTTRALSLIISTSEKVQRPWFSDATNSNSKVGVSVDDHRIAHLPLSKRKDLIKKYISQPDVMISENVAMTCRVSPSFIRVGQIELFARRYRKALSVASESVESQEMVELHPKEFVSMVEHLLFREYSDTRINVSFIAMSKVKSNNDSSLFVPLSLQSRILYALRESSQQIATMTAAWMRVGYCQGNFNSDNCLVAGRTMDYGNNNGLLRILIIFKFYIFYNFFHRTFWLH
jgi:uncharacterized protein YdiU (UPF0061 family)